MKQIIIPALIIVAALFIACQETPMEKKASTNPDVPVELLFEHEGCRMYRFHDAGMPIYYAVCKDQKRTDVSWSQPEGKVAVPFIVSTVKQ